MLDIDVKKTIIKGSMIILMKKHAIEIQSMKCRTLPQLQVNKAEESLPNPSPTSAPATSVTVPSKPLNKLRKAHLSSCFDHRHDIDEKYMKDTADLDCE
jgi:hypothetical protein